eukprot:GEMP01059938.1.p1 GENE.GEMP01059938.1~~GEMP01059938.1.p1  ORF type:complete len:218 (+),score=47.07 GEMP01059938.1:49-702(+)
MSGETQSPLQLVINRKLRKYGKKLESIEKTQVKPLESLNAEQKSLVASKDDTLLRIDELRNLLAELTKEESAQRSASTEARKSTEPDQTEALISLAYILSFGSFNSELRCRGITDEQLKVLSAIQGRLTVKDFRVKIRELPGLCDIAVTLEKHLENDVVPDSNASTAASSPVNPSQEVKEAVEQASKQKPRFDHKGGGKGKGKGKGGKGKGKAQRKE